MADEKKDLYAPDGYESQEGKLGPSWPTDDTKANDEVKGTLKDRTPSEFGKDNFILEDATVNGEKVVDAEGEDCELLVWGSAVLNNRMTEAKTDDEVAIRFDGTELPKVKGHNPTKMFSVAIKK